MSKEKCCLNRAEKCCQSRPKLSASYKPKKVLWFKVYHASAAIWCPNCKRSRIFTKVYFFKPNLEKIVDNLIGTWNQFLKQK